MIRVDGYYIEEPKEIFNGRSSEQKSSYSFNAYYFVDNHFLKISSKHDFLSNISDFIHKDFKDESTIVKKVNIQNNKIEVNKSFPFEDNFTLKILSPNKIFNETIKKHLYFVSWLELGNRKSKDFKDSCINQIFGPFTHKKFEVYYE
jgi:hypothetical protein